jgi:hypothetical protein
MLLKNEMAQARLHDSFGFKEGKKFEVGPDTLNLVERQTPNDDVVL